MSYDPRQHGAMCDSCPLQGCRAVAPETSHRATVAIVGEAPGEQEEKIGRPFVGPSGMELDRAIRMAGASRGDFHITNALCCRPPDNDLKKLLSKISRANKAELAAAKEEEREPSLIMSPIECCAPRLEGELARFNNFITLGSTGTNAVTKHHDSILAIRGGLKELSRKTAGAVAAFAEAEPQAKQLTTKEWNEAFGDWQAKNGYSIRVMPTLHPAFILRQQRWAHVFRNDIFKAMKHFRGETGWVVPKATYNPDPHTLQKFLSDTNRVYTFDIETDGIESLTAHIRCIAIGDSEEVMVVGFRSNTRPRDQEGLFLDFYTELEGFVIGGILVGFFTNKDIIKVGHNAGMYDRLVLRSQMHIDPTPVFDTILLHRNVESELPHSLAYVASLYTDAPSWKCYDSETEVLTRQGWVQFPLLPHGVEVAQWDKGVVSFVKPQAYVDQLYTGKMWQLKDQATDLLVTPDHKMVYSASRLPAHESREEYLRVCQVQDIPTMGSLPHVPVTETESGNPILGETHWSKLSVLSRQEVDYDGRIYCVSVPSGFLLVRRNGKVTVSGNTDRDGNKLALGGESDQELAEYCLKDVAITARCFTPLLEQVRLRDQVEVWKSDQKMQLICADMHMVGMYVDQKKRMAEEKKLLKLRHELLEKIRSGLDKPKFNPASVYQMRDVLFKEWGLESHLSAADLREEDLETSSGDLSTGDLILRTLLTLRTVDENKRDIIKLIRRYRKCMKILGTYVVKLRPWNMGADLGWDEDDDWVTSEMRKKYGEEKRGIVDPRTGRMHPGYNMHVAVTGRLSSSKPLNAQNFPVSQRSMIVAQPGNVLVGADMDQLELRIAAALWEVELYLRAFREGKDPHSMTAYTVFGDAFCKAAGMSASAFHEPGVLVGACFDEHGVFQKGVNKDAKSMRDLSKAVQYASVSSEVKVTLLDSRRAVPICEVSRGDWTWAWSTKNLRYEPARVKHVWPHGEKECVRVTFSWNAPKNGGTQTGSVVVTADHPMLMRNGVLRHAGSLSAGDRLMPFHRDDAEDGYSYLNPGNNSVRVGEHRVVKGFYTAGERQKHVHHKNGKRRDNCPSNLEVLDHLDHYQEHKEAIDAGRVNSPAWRAAVSNPETRSAASSKAWEGRRERQDTDKTYGPRGSVLDTVKDQIGVKTDAEVAAMVGCTQELVGMYRKAHSIAPPVGQKGWLRWLLTNDVLWNRLLHDNTDVEMARLVNEHFDVEATRDGVAKTRKLLGIPAVKKGRVEVYPRRQSKLDAFADRVGHEKDAVIAAEAGCTAEAVGMYRKKHGIPLYWKEAPGGNNHTVVSIEPVGVREVWDIEVEHEDHNFALEAGIFVHNSQYMASVETVHQLIQKTELPATDPNTGKPLDDGTTDLPYAKLPLKRVREMRDAWLKGAPEFEQGWEKEIGEFREQGYLRDPVAGRRRDFLDGEEPNQIVNLKIQAAAAGLMNKALIEIAEEIPGHKWGPGTGVINQCHDSIAIECPESEAEKVVKLMEERMNQEHPALRGVKFSATAVIGNSWKDV